MAAAFWERSYHCSVQVGEIYILACTILLCTWSSLKVITTGNLGCFRIRLPFCASKLAPEIKKNNSKQTKTKRFLQPVELLDKMAKRNQI